MSQVGDKLETCGELLHKTTEQLHAGYQLCSRHFEDSQFMSVRQTNRLVHDAVPTLFNIPNHPKKVTLRRKLPSRIDCETVTRKKDKGIFFKQKILSYGCVRTCQHQIMEDVDSLIQRIEH